MSRWPTAFAAAPIFAGATPSTASPISTRLWQLDPLLVKVYVHRGIFYRDQGDFDRAIADFSAAIKVDPQFSSAFVNRCVAYKDKGENDRAIEDCDKAIRYEPNVLSPITIAALPMRRRATRMQHLPTTRKRSSSIRPFVMLTPIAPCCWRRKGKKAGGDRRLSPSLGQGIRAPMTRRICRRR